MRFKERKGLFSIAIANISIFFILQKEKNFFLIIPVNLIKSFYKVSEG